VEAWIEEHRKGGAPGKGSPARSGKPSAGFAPEERASA
jgi:hypothetical protein